jgi:ubiquinone/menaquinone biosynthesis C-methylase UbiE
MEAIRLLLYMSRTVSSERRVRDSCIPEDGRFGRLSGYEFREFQLQHDDGEFLTNCGPSVEQQKRTDAYFEAASAYWKEIYEFGDVDATIYRERRAVVLAHVRKLELSTEWPILEIGCGSGLTSVALAKDGYTVQATDSVDAMIKLAREHAEEAEVSERVITSIRDVHNLDFPDNSFSLVLKIGVAPWLHSLDIAVREVARVLRPGGYLITTADNWWRLNYWLDPRYFPPLGPFRKGFRNVLERLSLRQPSGAAARLHSIREFDTSIAAAGFEKIEGRTVGFGPFSFLGRKALPDSSGVKVHHWLQNFADHGVPLIRSAGTHYIVLARKGVTP